MDEALKWRRWSMTAIERAASLTNVPISPGWVKLGRPHATPPSLQKMDVCVCGLWQSHVSCHASWVY